MEIQIDLIYSADQIESIFSKLLSGDFAKAYSPHFEVWSSQTKEELLSGRKIAIGAWTVPDDISGIREDLVGVCILRKAESLIEPELVLEVIYVDEKYRNPHYYQSSTRPLGERPDIPVGSSLLKKGEKLCQKYGYTQITTEISTLHVNLVFFLLRQQFVINGYEGNKNRYRLIKYVEPVYNKDPYDVEMLVDWFCDQWRVADRKWVEKDHVVGSLTIGKQTGWSVDIHLLICQDSAELKRRIKKRDRALYFVLFKTDEDQIPAELKDQLFFIQPVALKREAKNQFIDLTLQDYVAAVVVSIRKELFSRFNPDQICAFLDGAEYGHVLSKRSQQDNRHVFIVFSNSDTYNQEILGVGRIQSIHTKTPDEMWHEFGSISSFSSKKEFEQYANIKTRMTAIVFDQLEIDDERIDLSKELTERGWCYMSDEQFYRIILSSGGYPRTLRLVKG